MRFLALSARPLSAMSKLICICSQIDEETIRQAIQQGADTLEAIQEETTANTGCLGCTRRILALIADETNKAK
jgi:NAD(P)H-nitrite reductase large subunit